MDEIPFSGARGAGGLQLKQLSVILFIHQQMFTEHVLKSRILQLVAIERSGDVDVLRTPADLHSLALIFPSTTKHSQSQLLV